jgi:hypothetical protein
MKRLKLLLFLSMAMTLGACVTINVYFPAAAAEKAAEEFVGDVLGAPPSDGSLFSPFDLHGEQLLWAAAGVLNFFVTSAEAQQAEIDIDTPQINAIKARMAQRQRDSLNTLFDAGALAAMTVSFDSTAQPCH